MGDRKKIPYPLPPADKIGKQLAAAVAESRYLRRLLRVARAAEQAHSARNEATKGARDAKR